MFRITRVSADLLEFEYANQFRVAVPCAKFRPAVERIEVRRVPVRAGGGGGGGRKPCKDAFPRLSDYWMRAARDHVAGQRDLTTTQVSLTRSRGSMYPA
jgi:hypothetical protein